VPLSSKQRAALAAKAKADGLDEAALIAAAEQEIGVEPEKPDKKAAPDKATDPKAKPPLYQYHLPFVTVNEVRTIWLELPPLAGGDENAAAYSAKQMTSTAPAASAETPREDT
jgi:hypothetical protein